MNITRKIDATLKTFTTAADKLSALAAKAKGEASSKLEEASTLNSEARDLDNEAFRAETVAKKIRDLVA